MKRILVYSEEEKDMFHKIYSFLNKIEQQLDDEKELTSEREQLLGTAQDAINKIENMCEEQELD